MTLELHRKVVFTSLVYLILVLLLINSLGIISRFCLDMPSLGGLIPLFDFNHERNIPTLYSSVSILVCSALLAIIAFDKRSKGGPYVEWLGLSLIFLFLSIDEISSIHEELVNPVRTRLKASGLFYYSWVIPYGTAVAVLGIAYLRFLRKLPEKMMFMFILSGVIFVSGAIGFEMLGGRHVEIHGYDNVLYAFYYTCEEFLEMFGIAVFIYSLLTYIAIDSSQLKITIK